MPLTLILIRHAKSSWDDPTADDHARVLNARGRRAAPAIGGWLAQHGYQPDLILCSDAARTQETARLILPKLELTPNLVLTPNLYHASPDSMLDLIQKQTAACVALIGHNPGIGLLAAGMIWRPPNHPRFADYPTCATTVIRFDTGQWPDVRPHSGDCIAFTVPDDLTN